MVDGKNRPRMYLACERSGQYKATKKLKHDGNNTSRIIGTKKYGCPFDMRALRFTTHDEWILTVVCRLHNHPFAEHLEGHSYVERLSKDEKALLIDMSESMVLPKEILVTFKLRDDLNISTLIPFTLYAIEIGWYRELEDHRCNTYWVNWPSIITLSAIGLKSPRWLCQTCFGHILPVWTYFGLSHIYELWIAHIKPTDIVFLFLK